MKGASEAQKTSRVVFSREIVARQPRESLFEIYCFHSSPNPFSREELSRELLVIEGVFDEEYEKCNLDKNSKHESIKNTFKNK